MTLAGFPLEVRCEALVEALLAEPELSVWARAELVMAAIWPRPPETPGPPPLRAEWKPRGLASTQAERDEVVALLEAGWTVGQVADATGWQPRQVKMWARRARAEMVQ